jgi:hypothetical protein
MGCTLPPTEAEIGKNSQETPQNWGYYLLALVLILLAALFFFSGCCPCRHLQTDTRDSIRVETHTVTIERIDTQIVTLPVEVYINTTRDTSSRLVGRWAESTAAIRDGFLTHTLTARGEVPVQVKVVERWRDSIQYRDREVTQVVEVAKPLTGWQKFQKRGFWVLLVVVIVAAGVSLVRWYVRKKL